MNEVIGLLSSSLSGDLLQFVNNFEVLMDSFVGSISSLNLVHISNVNDLPYATLTIATNVSSQIEFFFLYV